MKHDVDPCVLLIFINLSLENTKLWHLLSSLESIIKTDNVYIMIDSIGDYKLPCIPGDVTFACSSAEVITHEKVTFEGSQLPHPMEKQFEALC